MSGRLTMALVVCLLLIYACGSNGDTTPEGTSDEFTVKSGFADIPGGRLFYEVAGKGEEVVLIHGGAGDCRHWDHQFKELAQEFRVIRYDVRGDGRSTLPTEGESYSDHDDLAALLDHLGIEKAHIGGWSNGSAIAVDFAVAYPRRVVSLIPEGPWVFGYSSEAASDLVADLTVVATVLAESGPEAAADAFMEAPFFANTIRDPEAGAEFREILADYSWWDMSHISPQRTLDPSAVGRLSEIRVPTLILTAEYDVPACLEIAELLDQSVPNSRMIVMADTGHLMHMEKPEEFNQHVLEFLQSVGGK